MKLSLTVATTTLAMSAMLALSAAPAAADIVVVQGVNNQGTDNVLLTDATNVAAVTGTVNSGLFDVFFESATGNLNAAASGQAVISPATGNDPFTDLSFYIQDATFTRAVFNLNSALDGFMLLHVLGVNIDGGVFEQSVEVDANGQNFFTVDAINGQLITSIALIAQGNVEFEDLRQVRIGGVEPLNVPEPATLLLLGAGLVFAGARLRRRS